MEMGADASAREGSGATQSRHLLSSTCKLCQQAYSNDAWLLDSPFTSWIHSIFYDEDRCFCYFCNDWHCRHCMARERDLEDPESEEQNSENDESKNKSKYTKLRKALLPVQMQMILQSGSLSELMT